MYIGVPRSTSLIPIPSGLLKLGVICLFSPYIYFLVLTIFLFHFFWMDAMFNFILSFLPLLSYPACLCFRLLSSVPSHPSPSCCLCSTPNLLAVTFCLCAHRSASHCCHGQPHASLRSFPSSVFIICLLCQADSFLLSSFLFIKLCLVSGLFLCGLFHPRATTIRF